MCEVTLEVDSWPGHLAGQHVDIRLRGGSRWQRPHSYSIGNAPGTGDMPSNGLRLAVPIELLMQLDRGRPVQITGPKGDRMAWAPGQTGGRPLLLIGGGSGIVPLLAIAYAWASQPSRSALRLIHSVRSRQEQLYRDELSLLEIECGARVASVVTRGTSAASIPPRGRLGRHDLESFGLPPSADPECFVCGPSSFVESVVALLEAAGHPAERIRTEWAVRAAGAAA
ncbi:ferredoxin--NADP reductase [Humibacter antri]